MNKNVNIFYFFNSNFTFEIKRLLFYTTDPLIIIPSCTDKKNIHVCMHRLQIAHTSLIMVMMVCVLVTGYVSTISSSIFESFLFSLLLFYIVNVDFCFVILTHYINEDDFWIWIMNVCVVIFFEEKHKQLNKKLKLDTQRQSCTHS